MHHPSSFGGSWDGRAPKTPPTNSPLGSLFPQKHLPDGTIIPNIFPHSGESTKLMSSTNELFKHHTPGSSLHVNENVLSPSPIGLRQSGNPSSSGASSFPPNLLRNFSSDDIFASPPPQAAPVAHASDAFSDMPIPPQSLLNASYLGPIAPDSGPLQDFGSPLSATLHNAPSTHAAAATASFQVHSPFKTTSSLHASAMNSLPSSLPLPNPLHSMSDMDDLPANPSSSSHTMDSNVDLNTTTCVVCPVGVQPTPHISDLSGLSTFAATTVPPHSSSHSRLTHPHHHLQPRSTTLSQAQSHAYIDAHTPQSPYVDPRLMMARKRGGMPLPSVAEPPLAPAAPGAPPMHKRKKVTHHPADELYPDELSPLSSGSGSGSGLSGRSSQLSPQLAGDYGPANTPLHSNYYSSEPYTPTHTQTHAYTHAQGFTQTITQHGQAYNLNVGLHRQQQHPQMYASATSAANNRAGSFTLAYNNRPDPNTALSMRARALTTGTVDGQRQQPLQRVVSASDMDDEHFNGPSTASSNSDGRVVSPSVTPAPAPPLGSCLCCVANEEGRSMVLCDKCNVWYHLGCVGVYSDAEAEAMNDQGTPQPATVRSSGSVTAQKGVGSFLCLPCRVRAGQDTIHVTNAPLHALLEHCKPYVDELVRHVSGPNTVIHSSRISDLAHASRWPLPLTSRQTSLFSASVYRNGKPEPMYTYTHTFFPTARDAQHLVSGSNKESQAPHEESSKTVSLSPPIHTPLSYLLNLMGSSSRSHAHKLHFDRQLCHAIVNAMHYRRLSQIDVVSQSHIPGGQAALSSFLNGKAVGRLVEKQCRLRAWLQGIGREPRTEFQKYMKKITRGIDRTKAKGPSYRDITVPASQHPSTITPDVMDRLRASAAAPAPLSLFMCVPGELVDVCVCGVWLLGRVIGLDVQANVDARNGQDSSSSITSDTASSNPYHAPSGRVVIQVQSPPAHLLSHIASTTPAASREVAVIAELPSELCLRYLNHVMIRYTQVYDPVTDLASTTTSSTSASASASTAACCPPVPEEILCVPSTVAAPCLHQAAGDQFSPMMNLAPPGHFSGITRGK